MTKANFRRAPMMPSSSAPGRRVPRWPEGSRLLARRSPSSNARCSVHLRQYRLHSDKNPDRQRLCDPHGAPRGRFRGGGRRTCAGRYGPGQSQKRHDFRAVVIWSRRSLKTLENCTVYRGHARFASPHAPDDSRRPRCRKGRDPRLHEDAGRCRQPGNPGCGDSRDRR